MNQEEIEKTIMAESNGFENFEGVGKYISVQEEIDKKADKYGNISFTSMVVAVVCHIIYGVIVYFLNIIPFGDFQRLIDVVGYIYSIVSSSVGVVSLVFAILGYRIKRTNLTTAMLVVNLLFSVGGLIMFVQIFGGLYLFLSSLR